VDRDPEADLADVRRVLAGEADAFEGIVRRFEGPLVNLAYRYVRDPGRAEEMAQEAFLRIFDRLDRYGAESPFSTWVFAVALNVYRSELRRHPMRLVHAPLDQEPVDASASPEARHGDEDERRVVREAVACLPARYREPLILFYFLESNVEETGRVLGLPPGTVKARLHRGRALLRRRLAGRR
jgi:RNA polymerase sigma-70 factor (ECF subfamily)